MARRLQLVGKGGAPPGRAGLPGVKAGLSVAQRKQGSFVTYGQPGQAHKVLKPGNLPFKPLAPSKGPADFKVPLLRNSYKGDGRLFVEDTEVQQLGGGRPS